MENKPSKVGRKKKVGIALAVIVAILIVFGSLGYIQNSANVTNKSQDEKSTTSPFKSSGTIGGQPVGAGSSPSSTSGSTLPGSISLQSAKKQVETLCNVGSALNSIPATDLESVIGSAITGNIEGKILDANCKQIQSTLMSIESKMSSERVSSGKSTDRSLRCTSPFPECVGGGWYNEPAVLGDLGYSYGEIHKILKERFEPWNMVVSRDIHTVFPKFDDVQRNCDIFPDWERQYYVRGCEKGYFKEYTYLNGKKYWTGDHGIYIIAGVGDIPEWVLIDVPTKNLKEDGTDSKEAGIAHEIFWTAITGLVCESCWENSEPLGYTSIPSLMSDLRDFHLESNLPVSSTPTIKLGSKHVQFQIETLPQETGDHWRLLISY